MHPQPRTWRDAFDAAPADARRLADGLDDGAFNAPPMAGAWSVGQCLDHLVRTAAPLLPRLEDAVSALRKDDARAAAPYALGMVGSRFAALNGPVVGRGKAKTPAASQPPVSVGTAADVLDAFAAVNERLSRLVVLGDGLALASRRVPSPALSLLRLNVAAWLETTMQHQQRHLAQAARARAALGL